MEICTLRRNSQNVILIFLLVVAFLLMRMFRPEDEASMSFHWYEAEWEKGGLVLSSEMPRTEGELVPCG